MLLPTLKPIIIITLITCEISYKLLKYQPVEIAARSWKSDKVDVWKLRDEWKRLFGPFFFFLVFFGQKI